MAVKRKRGEFEITEEEDAREKAVYANRANFMVETGTTSIEDAIRFKYYYEHYPLPILRGQWPKDQWEYCRYFDKKVRHHLRWRSFRHDWRLWLKKRPELVPQLHQKWFKMPKEEKWELMNRLIMINPLATEPSPRLGVKSKDPIDRFDYIMDLCDFLSEGKEKAYRETEYDSGTFMTFDWDNIAHDWMVLKHGMIDSRTEVADTKNFQNYLRTLQARNFIVRTKTEDEHLKFTLHPTYKKAMIEIVIERERQLELQ